MGTATQEVISAVFYETTYRIDGYTLADAFRPQPDWGTMRFRVSASELPEHTDQDVVDAARKGAPVGYWLQRVEAIGGDPHIRELMSVSVPVANTTQKQPA